MISSPDSHNAIQELLEFSDFHKFKKRPTPLSNTPISSSRWNQPPSLVYLPPTRRTHKSNTPGTPQFSPRAAHTFRILGNRPQFIKKEVPVSLSPSHKKESQRMLLSSIVSQEEQASWKIFKDFKTVQRETALKEIKAFRPMRAAYPKEQLREDKILTPISRLQQRAVTSTFSTQKGLERKLSHSDVNKAATPGWRKEDNPRHKNTESIKTPKTPLLSSFTPRLHSDINYDAITPLVTEDQGLAFGNSPAAGGTGNIDIFPPKVVFAESQKKPVCYKFSTTLKTLKKPPTQQSFDRPPLSQEHKRTTDRKTSIDSRIDAESKHNRFHTYYGGYPQFILMNESEDETQGEGTDRKQEEEGEPLPGGRVKKLFENNALRTIMKTSGADLYESYETSTVGRGSVDSQDTGYLATKRFLSSRASPTPGEIMRGGEIRTPKGRGPHYFTKGRQSERSQMSKTFIGFHFDQSCINPGLLPDPTHSHLKALPKKSATPLPRTKQQKDQELQKKKQLPKWKRKKEDKGGRFEFKSPRVYLNALKKKEEEEEEEEHIEASKLILDFKRTVLLNSQSPARSSNQDFKIKPLNLQKRKTVDISRGMNLRKRKALPDLSQKRKKKEFSLLKRHARPRDLNSHDLQKSMEYNDLVQETKRARELFPYFQKGDKFNELVEHKTNESFTHLKQDPILNMTRAQLPGLTPVLRRLRAVSPMALLSQEKSA